MTGAVLVAVPLLFNVGFTLLARRFDYPDVLRHPTDEVLERFRQGGSSLLLIWWVFAVSAVLFAPLRSCWPVSWAMPTERWWHCQRSLECSPRSSSSSA